jgi:hypothetical protein
VSCVRWRELALAGQLTVWLAGWLTNCN